LAEDVSQLYEQLHRFNIAFAFGGGAMLLILLGVQRSVVRRSFRSLQAVTDELEKLAEGEQQSLSEQVPAEVRPLVDEVNHLLQLLAQRLQRSRNAMGNLAHSLKHPLSLLMQLAEQEALQSQPAVREALQQHTQQILQLMERELKRARLAGAGMPGQRFMVEPEVHGLADVLQRVYHHKHLTIDYRLEAGVEFSADRNDMLELLGNLLDNACKWCRHRVLLTMNDHQGLSIIIEDDGPGCDDPQLARLTERGVRIDESVAGSGLGLAIVKDIVQLYQGTLYFDRSPSLGGLRVRVKLGRL